MLYKIWNYYYQIKNILVYFSLVLMIMFLTKIAKLQQAWATSKYITFSFKLFLLDFLQYWDKFWEWNKRNFFKSWNRPYKDHLTAHAWLTNSDLNLLKTSVEYWVNDLALCFNLEMVNSVYHFNFQPTFHVQLRVKVVCEYEHKRSMQNCNQWSFDQDHVVNFWQHLTHFNCLTYITTDSKKIVEKTFKTYRRENSKENF